MSASAPSTSGRRMKYPYTFTARLAQFPYKFAWNYHWFFKYHITSIILCLPIFYQIEKLSKTPANIAKWEEIRRNDVIPHNLH